jgi:hypothetical protein
VNVGLWPKQETARIGKRRRNLRSIVVVDDDNGDVAG